MRGTAVRLAIIGAAGIVLSLAGACSSGRVQQTSRPGASQSPSFTVSGAARGNKPGIVITGVVPVAGSGVWDGLGAIVDYRRKSVDEEDQGRGEVDLSRVRLFVDGRRLPARVTVTTMSPAARGVIFSWDAACAPGVHVLRVVLPLYRSGSVTCTWSATKS
ncbi:MAG TPA: hypothetical protein VMH50_07185 [Thermoleophilia bacterium]|nr:hypothetical protein [Thermoleophilia bacterium]